jgi:hypothetical protein
MTRVFRDLRTALTGVKETKATLELIGNLMGKFMNRHEVSVNHDLMAGLTTEHTEAVVNHAIASQEAHGIVHVEAYLVEDAG